jgi:hypothetical protein
MFIYMVLFLQAALAALYYIFDSKLFIAPAFGDAGGRGPQPDFRAYRVWRDSPLESGYRLFISIIYIIPRFAG